jgi:hypothetical protein
MTDAVEKVPNYPAPIFLMKKNLTNDRRIDGPQSRYRDRQASLSSGNEVPHIFTRKSRLRPGKFLITGAKRVLQQYRSKADSCSAANGRLFDHLVRELLELPRHRIWQGTLRGASASEPPMN